jgi:hypothetical protein
MRASALNDLQRARLRLRKPVRQNLPAILLEAMAACLQIIDDRARFPELGGGRGQERFKFFSADRERDVRRLEAIVLVAQCILSHCDLVRLRSGRTRRDGSCDPIRVTRPRRLPGRTFYDTKEATIETETGLSRDRVVRALADLRDAGYMDSHQPKKSYEDEITGDTRWRGYAAVYTISKKFFERLGIDLEWLDEERKAAGVRENTSPEPLVDVRLQRERRRIIRTQARAARRVAAYRPSEAEAAAAVRRLQERTKKTE